MLEMMPEMITQDDIIDDDARDDTRDDNARYDAIDFHDDDVPQMMMMLM